MSFSIQADVLQMLSYQCFCEMQSVKRYLLERSAPSCAHPESRNRCISICICKAIRLKVMHGVNQLVQVEIWCAGDCKTDLKIHCQSWSATSAVNPRDTCRKVTDKSVARNCLQPVINVVIWSANFWVSAMATVFWIAEIHGLQVLLLNKLAPRNASALRALSFVRSNFL